MHLFWLSLHTIDGLCLVHSDGNNIFLFLFVCFSVHPGTCITDLKGCIPGEPVFGRVSTL